MTTPHDYVVRAQEREKIRKDLIQRKSAAIVWANKLGIKHWHGAQWGCSGECLDGIYFKPDLGLDASETGKRKPFKMLVEHYQNVPDPTEVARRKSAAVRQSIARRKRIKDLEAELKL